FFRCDLAEVLHEIADRVRAGNEREQAGRDKEHRGNGEERAVSERGGDNGHVVIKRLPTGPPDDCEVVASGEIGEAGIGLSGFDPLGLRLGGAVGSCTLRLITTLAPCIPFPQSLRELYSSQPPPRRASASCSFDISERPGMSASCARAYSSSFVKSSSLRGRVRESSEVEAGPEFPPADGP